MPHYTTPGGYPNPDPYYADEAKDQTVAVWLPIKTAPKSTSRPAPGGGNIVDGHYILAYCPEEGATPKSCITVVWWEPHTRGGCWWSDGDVSVKPTHWMPLPDPPITDR